MQQWGNPSAWGLNRRSLQRQGNFLRESLLCGSLTCGNFLHKSLMSTSYDGNLLCEVEISCAKVSCQQEQHYAGNGHFNESGRESGLWDCPAGSQGQVHSPKHF
eukprot:1159383-Pelagomonas_calceolata.AAC.1